MGRAKLKMELIRNQKSRNITFKKRKDGLVRKIYELTTLCDVEACMIIYGPEQKHCNFAEPEIFPQDPNEVKRMIGVYKAKSKDSMSNKNFTMAEFYQERKRKVEEDLAKARKKNLEAKYPIRLDNLVTEAGCANFHDLLTKKAEYVRELLDSMKMNNMRQRGLFNIINYNNMMNNMPQRGGFNIMNSNTVMDFAHARTDRNLYGPSSFIQPMGVLNNLAPTQFPATEHHQNQEMHLSHQGSMMRLLFTGNEYHASGPSNGSYQQKAVFFDSATRLDPTVICHNERTMPYMQIQPPQQMQLVSNHHLLTGGVNEEGQHIVQYQTNNNVARYHHG